LWPALAAVGLALVLAITGLCWPLLAFVGSHWPPLVLIGCFDCCAALACVAVEKPTKTLYSLAYRTNK